VLLPSRYSTLCTGSNAIRVRTVPTLTAALAESDTDGGEGEESPLPPRKGVLRQTRRQGAGSNPPSRFSAEYEAEKNKYTARIDRTIFG
jgi:hypothetical protein